jgi:TolB protein
MDETTANHPHSGVRVTVGAPEYAIAAGKSDEIIVLLANPGPQGNNFEVVLLGIPPSWVTYSGPRTVWIPGGGQEKVILKVSPPAASEGVTGTYHGLLFVYSQDAPESGERVGVRVIVLPGEKPEEKPEKKHEAKFLLRVEANEFPAIPGTEVKIQPLISNLSQEAEQLNLSVEGAPEGWVYLPAPSITLSGGEERKLNIVVRIPTAPEIAAGYLPLKILAVSKIDPAIREEAAVRLLVAAFESHGRVGVMLKSLQFSVAPGESLTIPLTVMNRGLDSDDFRLGVKGIPVSWVSTSDSVSRLAPGEAKEITMVVQPPLSPSSHAGRHKFSLAVASQADPDQVVKVDCVLIVATHTQFRAELEPQEVEAGKPVRVNVKNDGNVQQAFHLTCKSQNDQLVFEFLPPEAVSQPAKPESTEAAAQPGATASTQPGAGTSTQKGATTSAQPGTDGSTASTPSVPEKPQPQSPSAAVGAQPADLTTLRIPPGESATFRFTARPSKRQYFGGAVSYPYQALVGATAKEALTLPGRVTSRGMIPLWVLPLALFLCLCLLFGSVYPFLPGVVPPNSETQTAAAGTALVVGMTQTMQTGTAQSGTAVSTAATPTVIANTTATPGGGQQDTDGDGLTDQRESEVRTDPFNPDSDGDGLLDGEEVFRSGTNPLSPDSDGDGLNDGEEISRRTNALNPDSDGDNSKDGDEVRLGTDPLRRDTDSDGLDDGSENQVCPNPLNPDSDQDGTTDGRDENPCGLNNPTPAATAPATQPPVIGATPTLPGIAPTQPPPNQGNIPRFRGIVLFESDRDGNSEIYTTDDAGHLNRITNNPAADAQAAWAPNLRQVAFTSNRDGQNEIYLMDVDGTNAINLTNNPADDQQPTWSLDGEWIAFSSNREGNYEIYMIRIASGEIRNLTNSPGNDTQPNWLYNSTTGELIVFTSDRDGNPEIYRMRTDGTEPLNLTQNPANDQLAKASLDGAMLVFTTNRDGNQEIYSMGIDGNGPANLTNNPANDFGPSWSSDRDWVAFTTERDGNREVYLTRPGTSEQSNLTNHPSRDQVTDWR